MTHYPYRCRRTARPVAGSATRARRFQVLDDHVVGANWNNRRQRFFNQKKADELRRARSRR